MPGYPSYSPEQEFIRPGAPVVRSLWPDPHKDDPVWLHLLRFLRATVILVVSMIVFPLVAPFILMVPLLVVYLITSRITCALWGLCGAL